MNTHHTYLWINFFTILGPLLFSFLPHYNFHKKWRHLFPAILLTGTFFLVWDAFFTARGIWHFNPLYVVGLYAYELPLEEYLFFFTVPYACTFIYHCLFIHSKKIVLSQQANKHLLFLSIVCAIGSLFLFSKTYTFSVLFLMSLFVPLSQLILKKKSLDNFLLAYLISIFPMLIVNGFLTSLPVVIYNNDFNSSIRLGSIPIEDFGYNFILLAMCIGLYDWLQSRKRI